MAGYDPNQPRNEDGEWTIAERSARKAAGLGGGMPDLYRRPDFSTMRGEREAVEHDMKNNKERYDEVLRKRFFGVIGFGEDYEGKVSEAMETAYNNWYANEAYDDSKAKGLIDAVYYSRMSESLSKAQRYIDESEYSINMSEESLMRVLKDGRFKSAFEETGMYTFGREEAEEYGFGYSQDLPGSERPIYGWAANPQGTGASDIISYYGDVRVVINKDRVADRVTATPVDSLNPLSSKLMLPSLASELDKGFFGFDFNSRDEFEATGVPTDYFELQFHGGLSIDDIAYVEVYNPSKLFTGSNKTENTTNKNLSQSLIDALRKRGIKIKE